MNKIHIHFNIDNVHIGKNSILFSLFFTYNSIPCLSLPEQVSPPFAKQESKDEESTMVSILF